MIDAAERRRKVKKQAEPKKLISESSDDEESDEEDTIDTATIKKAAKEKWNELLQSLIVEHVQKRKKNATGKKKKKNTISVTECSTSEKVKKGKRAAIEIDSDSDSDFERSYSKMAVVTMKKVKKEKIKLEDEGIIKDVKNNERKSINIRMSPRSLKKVLEKLRIPQVEELEKMEFGEFYNNFNFYSIPSELGFWVVRNFDLETRSIKMNDGRKIKITRELVRDMLGIPMGDMKVEALEEKNLFEETTAKWREVMESVVVKNKIYITKLEEHLISLTEVDWEFRVAFLVLFFSILGQGNKDGEVNERIIPILSNTENVSKMDWCSYVLECLVKECSQYKPNKFFSGLLLLLVLIYVNSTTSETVKVEKTIPAFKAWSSRLLFQRQKEEAELGFGCLPIADGVEVIEPLMKKKKLIKKHKKSVTGGEEDNLVCQLQTPKIDLKYGLYGTIDMEEANKDFRSKSFEEMKGNIRDNMALCNRLMLDIDYKLLISLRLNPEDEELKKLVETRNDLFAKSYKEDADKNENDGNRGENGDDGNYQNDQMGDQNKEDRDDENGGENGDDGNYENDQMSEQSINEEGTKDDLNESLNKKTALNEKHDLIDANDILKKVINKRNEDDALGKDLVGTKDNAIVPFDMDLISSQRGSQSIDEYENQSQEMQYDDLEDIVPLPESQEPKDIFSSKNKRRKLNHEDDVTLSQLSWAIGGEESMNETEMVDKIVKLPFMSTGITDAAKGLAADAPSATATPLYHSTKLKLKRNSSENYDVEKVDISNEAKKTTVDAAKERAVNVIDAAPVSFVAPINYVPLENIQKEKSVAATKSKADGKKAGNKKEPVKKAKKAASNEEPEKKGRGKKGETKQEMVKAKKAPTKKAEPKTVKDNTQKAKRGQKRGAEAVEEDKEGDIVKEKRTVKPSNAMKSPYYDRKVRIYKKWNEAEMKLVEYMWSDSSPEGDIVFNGKGLQLEGVFFLSLYPEVEVASTIIDLWSIILNKEEQFRDELSGKRNVYCGTLMLPHHMVDFDDGMHLEKRRMKFEENLNSVLETSGLKDLNDVGLIFFPCIKMTKNGLNHYYVICFNLKNRQIDILDNVNNGIENISDRYGKYAQVLIDTFINYLERKKHPKIADIWLASARMVPIKWKTTYNAVDCGIFVMRHMEMYVGEEVFLKELLTEGADLKAQLKMLRAKYLAKILLIDFNLEKKKLLKDAEAYAKKQEKKSKILTHTAVKDDENLLQRFNDTLVKTLE